MPTSSNVIFGKVILKESGLGIPDLLIIIFDRDSNTHAHDIKKQLSYKRGGDASALKTTGCGGRLGSVLTSIDGQFSFEYHDQEFRLRNPDEQRPEKFYREG